MVDSSEKIVQRPDNVRVFISHKNDPISNNEAKALYDRLGADHIEVYLDKVDLSGGDLWDEKLYRNIRKSDVMIVLLNDKESDWVQREVDMARGLNISILPIKIVDDITDINGVLNKLELKRTQYKTYCTFDQARRQLERKYTDDDDFEVLETQIGKLEDKLEIAYKDIVFTIRALTKETRAGQRDWVKEVRKLRTGRKFRPSRRKFRTFESSSYPCHFHIATGDIIDLKKVDVVVNSENNYMQMGRRVDSSTLSSALRYYGSEFDNAQNLLSDAVQNELNNVVLGSRPVRTGSVFSTSGGHPNSRLVKETNLKHIIHAATTRVERIATTYEFKRVDATEIPEITKACLTEFDRLNAIRVERGETLLTNIFFPVFNAGELEAPIDEILLQMLDGISDYFQDEPETSLKDIHFLAYTETELEVIEKILERELL